MKFKLFLAGILLSVLPALNSCNGSGGAKRAGGDTEVTELRCRDLDDPEGVDRAVFSWQIESEADSIVQTAWEIEIASDEKALKNGKADVWSSGKQLSDQQLNVRPQGADLKPGERYWWRVRIWDGADRPTSWSDPASFSLGPAADQWQAKWITAQWEEGSPLPYFRTVFNADQPGTKPVRAVIYLSGLGCSDLFFNGRRVDSTRILDPAQSNYELYALYSTFDVTDRLKKGDNCIGVMLGDGWYNQGKVWGPGFSYGKPILLAANGKLPIRTVRKRSSARTKPGNGRPGGTQLEPLRRRGIRREQGDRRLGRCENSVRGLAVRTAGRRRYSERTETATDRTDPNETGDRSGSVVAGSAGQLDLRFRRQRGSHPAADRRTAGRHPDQNAGWAKRWPPTSLSNTTRPA